MSLMMVDSNLCFNYCMHVSIMIYLQAWPDLKLVWLQFDYIAFFRTILWQYYFHHQLHESHTQSLLTLRGDFHDLVPLEPPWHLLGVSSLASGRAEIKSWGSSPGLLLLYHYTTLCFARCQRRAVGPRRWQEVKSSGYRTAMIVSTHCQLLCPPIATIAPQLPPLPARPLPDIQDYQIPNWHAHHYNVWNSHSSTDFTCHHLRRS